MKISRRDFITQSSGLLFSASPLLNSSPGFLKKSEFSPLLNCRPSDHNVLVVIHLAGGNDWFNTIVPYSNPDYYAYRPHLSLGKHKLLYLNDQFAFNSTLADLKNIYSKNDLAIVLNCNNQNHYLSHDKANRICYQTNNDNETMLQSSFSTLLHERSFFTCNVEPFFYKNEQNLWQIKSKVFYPETKTLFDLDAHYYQTQINSPGSEEQVFINSCQQIASLIKRRAFYKLYQLSLGGFDTHINQLPKHNMLLNTLSKGVSTLYNDLEKSEYSNNVLIAICSEFGRDIKENNDKGTDHGYTNHALLIGKTVKSGIYEQSNLFNPNQAGYGGMWTALLNNWLST